MKHLLLATIVILIAAIAFLSLPSQSREDLPDMAPRVIKGDVSTQGRVCCTVMINGTEQRCVAPENELCDACESFCAGVR